MTRLEFLRKNTSALRETYMERYNKTNPNERLSLKKISLPISRERHMFVELHESLSYKGMYYVYLMKDFTRKLCDDAVGNIILTFGSYKELINCEDK